MHKIIENGATVLLADDGMMLTNDSSFGKTVRLGKDDSGESWYEITEAEAEERVGDGGPSESEATDADYQAALREMGVKV